MVKTSEALLNTAQLLVEQGLNKGTSGNCSVRQGDGFLITPSGLPVEHMLAESMVLMQMDGRFPEEQKPSSEWRFHRDIFQMRPEVNAVIHTHSMFATTVACLRKNVPPFHYMIAVTGGDSLRCAPYALFGSQALSDYALAALKDRKACLLSNHGMITIGADLDEALAIAIEIENLCEQYWRLIQVTPNPPLLSEAEMLEVFQQFKGYGRWSNSD